MAHCDPLHLAPFYARRPRLGACFRLLGHAAVAAVVIQEGRTPPWVLPGITLALILVWLLAWRAQVGSLWRSAVVTALVAAFVLLSLRRLGMA